MASGEAAEREVYQGAVLLEDLPVRILLDSDDAKNHDTATQTNSVQALKTPLQSQRQRCADDANRQDHERHLHPSHPQEERITFSIQLTGDLLNAQYWHKELRPDQQQVQALGLYPGNELHRIAQVLDGEQN